MNAGSSEERRCSHCGALVAPDATWCGQCFTPLVEPEPQLEPQLEPQPVPEREPGVATGSAAARDQPVTAMWPCAVCGGQNPIALDMCATCGTPFADLMREAPVRPEVDPRDALVWSLIFPGLGHRKVGRPVDGLARAVLFALSVAMAALVAIAHVSSGATLGIFLLFMITALVVYVGSAYEAHGLAQGGDVLVSARALLWALVAVIMLSVVMLALAVVTATKG